MPGKIAKNRLRINLFWRFGSLKGELACGLKAVDLSFVAAKSKREVNKSFHMQSKGIAYVKIGGPAGAVLLHVEKVP